MDDVVRDPFGELAGEHDRTREGAILDRVASPGDLKGLTEAELTALCAEIREYIVDVVSQKGGHLGASLGVVELTVALLRVLALPHDPSSGTRVTRPTSTRCSPAAKTRCGGFASTVGSRDS